MPLLIIVLLDVCGAVTACVRHFPRGVSGVDRAHGSVADQSPVVWQGFDDEANHHACFGLCDLPVHIADLADECWWIIALPAVRRDLHNVLLCLDERI